MSEMEYFNVADIFGENVFNDTVMQARLPKKVYKKLHDLIEEGRELEVYSSVRDGDYGLQRGAEKLGITIEKLKSDMAAAGYKIP